MSGLKAYIAPTPDGTGLADYYLKSEADKVIAEKDEEIAKLKQKNNDFRYTIALLCKEKNHHKYKRCLAMAKLCNEKWLVHNFAEITTKLGFYDKWEKRWLELAEKFKEGV